MYVCYLQIVVNNILSGWLRYWKVLEVFWKKKLFFIFFQLSDVLGKNNSGNYFAKNVPR